MTMSGGRVLYDGAVWLGGTPGGVQRYFEALITRLPPDWEPVATTSRPDGGPFLGDHPRLHRAVFRRHAFRPNRLARVVERLYFRWLAVRRPPDVVHLTYYFSLTGKPLDRLGAPVVLTVWDMIHERYAAELDPAGEVSALKRRAVEAASVVICISHTTRRDLVETFGTDEAKIVVTHLAPSIDRSMAGGPEPVPDRPFVLFVGNRPRYKNFEGLLAAFAGARAELPELTLAVVGDAFTKIEARGISERGLDDAVHLVGRVSDHHLAKLYSCSLCLAYPSLYEGFGLPPLEAMACGTVVVASARGSIPEVVGDAGVLVDPEDPAEMARALVSVATDTSLRSRLVAAGSERVGRFSWDDLARQTLAVYDSVRG